jgi:prepilin-type N-terminal cleavage/methylation domain-containing protein
MKKLKINKGFTLIELLVVIAIIAILASILIPVVTSALDDAKIANMRDTGVGIYKSIFAADADDPVFGGNTVVWPGKSDGFESSTDYFVHLVTNDFIESDYSIFSGPGMLKLRTTNVTEFGADANAWGVTMNVNNKSASIPFLFSRNVDATGGKLPKAADGTPLIDNITPEATLADGSGRYLKFQDKAVVVVTKGGSGIIIKKRNLTDQDTTKNFNPTDLDLEIRLPPGGKYGGGAE